MALFIENVVRAHVINKADLDAKPELVELGLSVGDVHTFSEDERVFQLQCSVCGSICGEIRFPENHGRETDEALDSELSNDYSATCAIHS